MLSTTRKRPPALLQRVWASLARLVQFASVIVALRVRIVKSMPVQASVGLAMLPALGVAGPPVQDGGGLGVRSSAGALVSADAVGGGAHAPQLAR